MKEIVAAYIVPSHQPNGALTARPFARAKRKGKNYSTVSKLGLNWAQVSTSFD